MTRRSTKTVIVLSPLSLTTTPCKIRRGIAVKLLRSRLLLIAQDRFDSRDVAANLPHARRVLELAAGLLEAQVELLLAQSDQRLLQLVSGLGPQVFSLHDLMLLTAQTGDELGLHRQLGGGEREGLAGEVLRHAFQLEQHAARLHPRGPPLRRALALALAHLGRLGRHRHVREDADPQLADALHVARDGAARGLDLARREAAGLQGLQAVGTEIQLGAALGLAVDTALEGLPVFRSLRLQHNCRSSKPGAGPPQRAVWASCARLSWAMGSCAMISPLNTQTFTPQVP